ncbi:protease complex subunit PrcB family protein [Laceyella putida]|uniref:Protease complex subunit PrcB family protein n=1 Tax=Laceyella putida TaxID=110101 RepID=A0ABW2RHH4_9BACL
MIGKSLSFCLLAFMLVTALWGGNTTVAHASVKESIETSFNVEENLDSLPFEVQYKIDELQWRDDSGSALVHKDGRTYAILSLGVRPTTGYSINIDGIFVSSGQMAIWASEVRPNSNAVLVQQLTSPVKVISIPDPTHKIRDLSGLIENRRRSNQ